MLIQFKRTACIVLALITILCISAMKTPNESPGEIMARMQALGEELAKTNESHEFLKNFEGEWLSEISVMGMSPTSGTTVNTMIFDGRYLEVNYSGTFVGTPYEGKTLIGFDNYKNKFTFTSIDTLSTSMNHGEGLLDRVGTTITFWGTMDEWMTDEHDKPVMYKLKFVDKDHCVWEVHDLGIIPDNTLVVKVNYRRVK